MGMIPERTIDEVLQRADITEVVGGYVSLRQKGSNLWGLCPFHSEKSPSFSVSPSKQIYKCFGCGKGGNAINFIMEMEGLKYPEAIRFLAERYSIDIPEDNYGRSDSASKEKKERVTAILKEAARFYYLTFHDPVAGKPGRDYAEKRGLDKSTLDHFGIGYSPDGWDILYKHLRGMGYKDYDLMDSGIFIRSKTKGNILDLFRGRLMFPIFDYMGTIISFGGRALGDEKPKYINSPDSYVYKKQNHLYALNFAKKEKSGVLFVVEGYMDAIAMHKAGFCNTVASLGTAFTQAQLKLCARHCDEVVFFFDSDGAGQSAAVRAIQMMSEYQRSMTGKIVRIRIAKVPGDKDPDGYIKANGKEAFRSVAERAMPVDEYLMERAYNDNFTESNGLDKGKYQEDVLRYGSWIADDIRRSAMANKAAVILEANSDVIYQSIQRYADKERISQNGRKSAVTVHRENLKNRNAQLVGEDKGVESATETSDMIVDAATEDETGLLAFAIALGDSLTDTAYVSPEDVLKEEDFSGDTMKILVRDFFGAYEKGKGVSFARMTDFFHSVTINGNEAEKVMIAAYSQTDMCGSLVVIRDYYLKILYRVRLEAIENAGRVLIDRYYNVPDENQLRLKIMIDELDRRKADLLRKMESI